MPKPVLVGLRQISSLLTPERQVRPPGVVCTLNEIGPMYLTLLWIPRISIIATKMHSTFELDIEDSRSLSLTGLMITYSVIILNLA